MAARDGTREAPTRRRLLVLAWACVGGAACRRPRREFSCREAPALAPAEALVRANLGYRDRAAEPARRCESCAHFTAAAPEACGSCRLMRGPVHPEGTCSVWVVRS